MSSNTKFITNEENKDLLSRFKELINDTQYFDCLVGYFYTSGFHNLYKSLENTDKIRILIGINTDRKTYDLIQKSQKPEIISSKQTKDLFSEDVKNEIDNSKDSSDVEESVITFINWLRSRKLEIKAYKNANLHAKLYISTFREEDRDFGRVITGSSNFTKSGLSSNVEFNVELSDDADYKFAINKFNELWEDAVDVSEDYINTIQTKTWLSNEITPYELYLKFLYEYLKENINSDKEPNHNLSLPANFLDLQYQRDAVIDAERKIGRHGGVFLSDVVGLGKTYMAAMLAKKMGGKNLVIAPPKLLKKSNPGSWVNAFYDFDVRMMPYSSGKLDQIIEDGHDKYDNVIIDEAHEFRNEDTQSYVKLHNICQGKRVILVTATPFNNTPLDLLAQIKLFQPAHNSTLFDPEVKDLDAYFNSIQNRLNISKKKDRKLYLRNVKETSKNIREKILKHLMVRRTRTSIIKSYAKDLEKQKLKFPDVKDPEPILYELDEKVDKIFNKTLKLILEEFTYSRYTSLLYLNDPIKLKKFKGSQLNMGKFMKILLFKRLESSFHAFKKSIDRFIYTYTKFIETYESGYVYISKKKSDKIYQFLEDENDELINELIDKGEAEEYLSDEFNGKLIIDLKKDLNILEEIKLLWASIENDPKIDELINILKNDKNLKNKVIIFTESEETMLYLKDKLNPIFNNTILGFSGDSKESDKNIVINNFDGNANYPSDEYRILISTEVLSQGMNLHRSNVVINYDIPWNPTRMMQRVGRVQRMDTKFNEIFIYNFFPASKINENIGLKEIAESKINAFIEMLGEDSKLLTDEEISSHDLYTKLSSKETVLGEEEEEDQESKSLRFIREIRDNDSELFKKIRDDLPKKARTAKKSNDNKIQTNGLITFFRKGEFTKTYLNNQNQIFDLDFENSVTLLKADKNTKREKIGKNYFELLNQNKSGFDGLFNVKQVVSTNRGNENKLRKYLLALKNQDKFTEIEIDNCKKFIDLLNNGQVPKKIIKTIISEIKEGVKDEFDIYQIIKYRMDIFSFKETKKVDKDENPKEIILSEYLISGD